MYRAAPTGIFLMIAAAALGAGCYDVHGAVGDMCGEAICPIGERCCPACETGEPTCTTAAMCPASCRASCFVNDDCGPLELCARPPGECSGDGECRPSDDTCPAACDEVCGCDGRSYCNACEAAQAGVSVLRVGSCDADACGSCAAGAVCCPTCSGTEECIAGDACPELDCGGPCLATSDCAAGEFCQFGFGECSTEGFGGRCRPLPTECEAAECELVCGCDGVAYCSECEANRAGTAIAAAGECPGEPCGEEVDGCRDEERCDLGPACGADGGERCVPRPADCRTDREPVCGCDGRTYANECIAHTRGASVAALGRCPTPPRTCLEVILADPTLPSGVHTITPGTTPRAVVCDMDTSGGGWTLVAISYREPLDDRAGPYHDELATRSPVEPHPWVWDGLREVVGARTDIRFTCGSDPMDPIRVDITFYDVTWYQEITTGTDADSCFSEGDGAGYERPAPARRNNVTGLYLPAGTEWAAGYLEGEDACDDERDFTIDFADRGMDSNELDGTDWGEDDTNPKCGSDLLRDGSWAIWIRER